ncbi:hypothetical protein FQR65_LT16235 [Abscondita terminalis]|nr:hypothetical protein FQR65_LT16235 [Abscondita terminalis]
MCVAAHAFDLRQTLISMSRINWEVKDVMSQHNSYVDMLLREVQIFAIRLEELSLKMPVSSYVSDILWENIAHIITHTLVQGFSDAKKCTNGGRALMQLDFTQFLLKFEKISSLKRIPHKEYVENYVKAYYLPDSELEKWIRDHDEYSSKHLLGLGYVKRSGADGSGRDYEIKIASLLALRCALRRDVQDVWLGSNLDEVGNFDDVVLFKRSLDGSVVAYLMQLKHQDSPKNIKQREFTSNSKGSSKDFNLTKYYEEYAKIQTRIKQPRRDDETLIVTDLRKAGKIYYILYTNRAVNECDFIEEAFDEGFRFLNTSATESVYKFKGLNAEYSDSFLDDLYLFTEQTHLNNTEHLMKNEVKSVLGKDISNEELNLFVERYCAFVRMWGNDRNICQPLTKSDVLNQTTDSLLASYKISLSKELFACYSHPNKFIWNDLISKKLVTVVDFSDEVVTFLKTYIGTELESYDVRDVRTWSDIVKGGLQLLSNRNVRIFDAKSDVTVMEMYKHLWYEKKIPLLLQADTVDDYKKVHRVLKLGGFATRVIIVTKNDLTVGGIVKFKRSDLYLSSLADLGRSDLVDTLIRIPVKLQGRGPIQLKDVIDESMHGLIKVCDIIAILSGEYTIGNSFKELPRFFIERFFPKVLIKLKALDELVDDFFLIESEVTLTPKKNVSVVKGRDEALRSLPMAKNEHSRVHWLKYDRHLEWLQSFGGAASLDRYLYELPNFTKRVADLCSTVNIVSASPGMGKSVLLDYVALTAPTRKWVARMNLSDFEDKSFRDVLEFVRGNDAAIDRIIYEKFKLRGDVVILLDGFDEVSINRQEHVLEFAKAFVDEGFALWITTRAFMKSNLETAFGTIATTLVPFTVDDQRNFLTKYFGNESGHHQRAVLLDFVDKLLAAAQNNLHDWDYEFTGIPLQTKLLADVFYADCKKSCDSGVAMFNEHFDLIYLYDEFVRKKLDIMTQKFGRAAMEMRVLFEHQQKLFALRAVFPKVYLQASDVERQLEEFSRNDDYKMQFMQREGIVVIESGTVKFVHRTFAEYLAAHWLSENPTKDLVQLRFLNQYTFLFNLFDRIVSKNNALHSYVINLKKSDALDLIRRNPELAGDVD